MLEGLGGIVIYLTGGKRRLIPNSNTLSKLEKEAKDATPDGCVRGGVEGLIWDKAAAAASQQTSGGRPAQALFSNGYVRREGGRGPLGGSRVAPEVSGQRLGVSGRLREALWRCQEACR